MPDEKNGAEKALNYWSDYWRRMPRFNRGPKLSFQEHCAMYACLYRSRIPQAVVRNMFRVSRQTVSNMAGCREDDREAIIAEGGDGSPMQVGVGGYLTKNRNPKRKRYYPEVADEFDRLGPDAFLQKYYTKKVDALMRQMRSEVTGKIYPEDWKKPVDRDNEQD